MTVERLKQLQIKLKSLEKKGIAASKASVTVGFSQEYAIFVHENLEANHPVGKAKFLEDPARKHQNKIGNIVSKTVKAGHSVENGLLVGGMFLLARAKEEVPVDTGALKASGFVSLTRDEEQAATEAQEKGQAIMQAAKGTKKKFKK